jgi:formylglycine-generating enzyme required for sulfatase activity
VRDDFWMAATRFLRELEVRLLEGQNSAAVDLFPVRHAEKVLAAFGRAFGALPENAKEMSKGQEEFVKQAVQGLASEGKVICVRLALFAEMMKGKAWTPASLKAVGGAEGVGVTFLEETFSAATAPPEHRYHQKAARAVLQALLPETGSDIKGHMRSSAELREAPGYGARPGDFEDLIRILDNELRLITPTDPERNEEAPGSSSKAGERYYQLTHDYLVPSLREWLTRKQKETRRGRAELRLIERAALWNAKPEKRHLPAWWEWAQIRLFTRKKNWTPPQQQMMRRAAHSHALRGAALALLLAAATLAGLTVRRQVVEQRNATHAAGLVRAVLHADTAQVPSIIDGMAGYRRWTDPRLREAYDQAADNSRQKLHAGLALLPVDGTPVQFLAGRLLKAEPHDLPVIRDALAPHKDQLLEKLWAVVEKPEKGEERQRIRAAAALAKYDPHSGKWAKLQELVGNDLVAVPAVYLSLWMDALRPVRGKLLPQLSTVYRDARRRETERSLATDLLAEYAADNPPLLADLLMDADDKQFGVIYPKLKDLGEQGLPLLTGEIDKALPVYLPSSDASREQLAKRQANAAVALLRMNQPAKVWPLLQHTPDPRVRSYLIHRLAPGGANAEAVVKRLDKEPDLTARRALLLSLGEFAGKDFTPDEALVQEVRQTYRTGADPGLHAASEWLLRTWKQEAWLKQTNDEWAKDRQGREQKLARIKDLVMMDKEESPPQWYVNTQGQTMVVIPGPVEFVMGSPPTEARRGANEAQHSKRIGRTFVLSAKPVTLGEYRKFEPRYGIGEVDRRAPSADSPVIATNWFQAVQYCNWLSGQEGLPESEWCYEPFLDPRAWPLLAVSSVGLLHPPGGEGAFLALGGIYPGRTDARYEPGMRLARNHLHRQGYRLPTEAEMEYATRAGALTSRYYGETEELLPRYAWYARNSQELTWPVGSLKPNDLGLFDVQGNVYVWCQERTNAYPAGKGDEAAEDQVDEIVVTSTDTRVLRGSSFYNQASEVRSAARYNNGPMNRNHTFGFRLARTLPPGSFRP